MKKSMVQKLGRKYGLPKKPEEGEDVFFYFVYVRMLDVSGF